MVEPEDDIPYRRKRQRLRSVSCIRKKRNEAIEHIEKSSSFPAPEDYNRRSTEVEVSSQSDDSSGRKTVLNGNFSKREDNL